MRTSIALTLPLLFAFSFAAACGGESDNLPPPPPPPPPPPSAAPASSVAAPPVADTSASATDGGAAQAATPPVTLQEGAASPDPAAPTPTVKIVAPSANQVLKGDKAADFEVKLDVKNWTTAQGSAHVHLILDDKPYKPIYDPKKPVKLSELLGGAALDEGQHVLVAFPSRANHESVKTKGALAITEFWVGPKKAGAGQPTTDVKKPLLVYSRPKGAYNGDMANHVLVDFYLANDTLGDGKDHVTIEATGPGIDGKATANATKFGTPFYLDNLQNGSYAITLNLVDKDGNPVKNGSWNSVTRTITVDRNAPTGTGMPGMPGMSATDAGAPADAATK
jgi:hypothetical protein